MVDVKIGLDVTGCKICIGTVYNLLDNATRSVTVDVHLAAPSSAHPSKIRFETVLQ